MNMLDFSRKSLVSFIICERFYRRAKTIGFVQELAMRI